MIEVINIQLEEKRKHPFKDKEQPCLWLWLKCEQNDIDALPFHIRNFIQDKKTPDGTINCGIWGNRMIGEVFDYFLENCAWADGLKTLSVELYQTIRENVREKRENYRANPPSLARSYRGIFAQSPALRPSTPIHSNSLHNASIIKTSDDQPDLIYIENHSDKSITEIVAFMSDMYRFLVAPNTPKMHGVYNADGRRTGVISAKIPGFKALSKCINPEQPIPNKELTAAGICKLSVADYVFANGDGHLNNWGLDERDQLWLFDLDRSLWPILRKYHFLEPGTFADFMPDLNEAFVIHPEDILSHPLHKHAKPWHGIDRSDYEFNIEGIEKDPEFIKQKWFYFFKSLLITEGFMKQRAALRIKSARTQNKVTTYLINRLHDLKEKLFFISEFREAVLNNPHIAEDLINELYPICEELGLNVDELKIHINSLCEEMSTVSSTNGSHSANLLSNSNQHFKLSNYDLETYLQHHRPHRILLSAPHVVPEFLEHPATKGKLHRYWQLLFLRLNNEVNQYALHKGNELLLQLCRLSRESVFPGEHERFRDYFLQLLSSEFQAEYYLIYVAMFPEQLPHLWLNESIFEKIDNDTHVESFRNVKEKLATTFIKLLSGGQYTLTSAHIDKLLEIYPLLFPKDIEHLQALQKHRQLESCHSINALFFELAMLVYNSFENPRAPEKKSAFTLLTLIGIQFNALTSQSENHFTLKAFNRVIEARLCLLIDKNTDNELLFRDISAVLKDHQLPENYKQIALLLMKKLKCSKAENILSQAMYSDSEEELTMRLHQLSETNIQKFVQLLLEFNQSEDDNKPHFEKLCGPLGLAADEHHYQRFCDIADISYQLCLKDKKRELSEQLENSFGTAIPAPGNCNVM